MIFSLLLLAQPAQGGPRGSDIHAEMLATMGVYDDPELTAYLEGLVEEIVSVSEMAGERFTFTLLDSADLNAFATADNYVYMNRGLLNYIDNEAQVVSVLAHEVGHITQRHVDFMPMAAGGAKFITWLAAALSGSQEVMEAGTAYANSLIKGHGRDNELQADEAAARYMVQLGYDPDEMLQMLGTMKDLEILMKERAAQKGAPRRSYHGIFSTHPRNDMRLRSAVSKAKALDSTATRDSGEGRYREMTEGMVWGENFKEKEAKPERWSDMQLRVRFDYPDGWSHETDAQEKAVSGQSADGRARLGMQPQARTPQTPEEYLYNYLKIDQLRDGKEIFPARLKGYTGILPGSDGRVQLWKTDSKKPPLLLHQHAGSVTALAVHAPSKTVASGSTRGTIALYNAETGGVSTIIDAHSGPVVSIDFRPDGNLLASSGRDGAIRFWDMRDHRPICELIDFKETRRYVRLVSEHRAHYQRLE